MNAGTRRAGALAVLVAVAATSAQATPLNPVGAPTYWPSGYAYQSSTPERQHSVNNRGVAVTYSASTAVPYGTSSGRAARWDLSGAGIMMQGLSPAYDLPGAGVQTPYAINDAGVSVGFSSKRSSAGADLGTRAVRWDTAGNVAELGVLGTTTDGKSDATAQFIDAAGNAYGMAQTYLPNGSPVGRRPVRWDAGSNVATPLNIVGDGPGSGRGFDYPITDVNVSGTAIGYGGYFVGNASYGTRGIRWDPGSTDGVALSLPAGAPAASYTTPNAISGNGRIAGQWSADADPTGPQAIVWDSHNVATRLSPLSHNSSGYAAASAFDINDAGTVIGQSNLYSGDTLVGSMPVRWEAGSTTPVQLGMLGAAPYGYVSGFARAINDVGAAVGAVNQVNGVTVDHAVLWLPNTTAAIDLNSLIAGNSGWLLSDARAISDTGVVTGYGTYDADGPNGQAAITMSFSILIPQAGTYGLGDADFDADVDFADLLILAKNYNKASGGATNVADFDLNGTTNFADLLTLAKHYNTSAAALADASVSSAFAADVALAQSLVPEPATATTTLGLLGGVVLRVRRRRR